MDKFISINEKVPVVRETDVLVVGGGVAGIAAALAARRHGAKVTLLEKSIVLGGLATLGHVCVYLAICDGVGNKVYGGITEELLHLSIKYGPNDLPPEWKLGVTHVDNPSGRYRTTFNIPAFVMALDELMKDEDVDVVFDAVFSSPIMEGDICRGVTVESKSGRTAYMAKMVIDASGDADVLARAGADCITSNSVVTHWCYETDFERMKTGIEANNIWKCFNLRWVGQGPTPENYGKGIAGDSCESVNEYIKYSRSLALDYLKKNQRPDYFMLTMPWMPQYRTTRMIKGIAHLELNDGAFVSSSIGCMTPGLGTGKQPIYEFPYEGLLDPKLPNIAAAGRLVAGGNADGWAQTRFIPACTLTGEAAGTAAALAVQEGCTLHQLPVQKLQSALEKAGARLHA